MPPKKRTRVSQATSPEQATEPPTQSTDTSPRKTEEKESVQGDDRGLAELWTDEEEIGLFKGLMRWKPTGIHKHFRLLALHNWLLQNQYIQPNNAHTSLSGIRAKLQTLYDLDTLDAREDARQLSKINNPLISDKDKESDSDDDADAYSEAANKIEIENFALPPEADFEMMMWKCRFATEDSDNSGSESPVAIADLNLADEPPIDFTPSFSVEPSEVATPRPRASRGRGRGRGGRGGSAAASTLTRRRSARQVESVADEEEEKSEQDEEEDEGDEDEDEADEDEEEDGDSEEDNEDAESQASTPAPSSARSMRGRRGRGPASSSAAATRRTRKRQR